MEPLWSGRVSWDGAEEFVIEGFKFVGRTCGEAIVFLVVCAAMAWGVMCTLGAVHLDVHRAVPAPGFIVTWIVVTMLYIIFAFGVWLRAYILNAVKA